MRTAGKHDRQNRQKYVLQLPDADAFPQPACKGQHTGNFGKLRGLEADRPEANPSMRPVDRWWQTAPKPAARSSPHRSRSSNGENSRGGESLLAQPIRIAKKGPHDLLSKLSPRAAAEEFIAVDAKAARDGQRRTQRRQGPNSFAKPTARFHRFKRFKRSSKGRKRGQTQETRRLSASRVPRII